MKILFATSEAVPLIKSGGLADVSGSLSKALRNRFHACRVVLPLYEDIPQEYREKMKYVTNFSVPLGWRNQYCGVFELTIDGVKHYLLDNEYYFKRHGLYGFFDDAERFSFYSKAVLEMLNYIDFAPEIIHCNDWQTALVPVYLNVFYRQIEKYRNVKTVFTIHNIQYQGIFDPKVRHDVAGLSGSAASIIEFEKKTNYMKGAVEQCDALTTVSPSYAEEILDPWFSHGLDGILQANQYKLSGILNGIDYQYYDPATDEKLPANYTAKTPKDKGKNKKDLQLSLGLEPRKEAMVIAMVTRLVEHKGLDLVKSVFDQIMHMDVQVVLLGSGDWQYENYFVDRAGAYPGRVAVRLGFDEPLSHKIYSGADVFLMPSKSEPCGLSQMISLRYGTIPIVRSTGGLKDSIRDFGGENGNGYDFLTYNAQDMLDAIQRAYGDFQDKKGWQAKIAAAMACDYSWGRSAAQYIALYKGLLEN